MNTELISTAAMTYPGFAFAAGAASLWAVRYVYKLKAENEQMKADNERGERAVFLKIDEMEGILGEIELEILEQTNGVEEELIERQMSTLNQKEVLAGTNKLMIDSIAQKEVFHDNLLTQFEEIELMLDAFERVEGITETMIKMRTAFAAIQQSGEEMRQFAMMLQEAIQANATVTDNIVREVGA